MTRSNVLAPAAIVAFAVAPAHSTAVAGGDYYVDKDSIGGPCSDEGAGIAPSAPWCTIARANRTLTGGDRVTFSSTAT